MIMGTRRDFLKGMLAGSAAATAGAAAALAMMPQACCGLLAE